jgi:hypothetical protein
MRWYYWVGVSAAMLAAIDGQIIVHSPDDYLIPLSITAVALLLVALLFPRFMEYRERRSIACSRDKLKEEHNGRITD